MRAIFFILGVLYLSTPLMAQDELTLMQCREMALQHNKELLAAAKQTDYARFIQKSYKGNFFPNLTANGMGMYTDLEGSLHMPGGNLPVLAPDLAGNLMPNGNYALFPGINLGYKMEMLFMGGINLQQPLYMGGQISAAYRMATLGKEMAQSNERLTANEVIIKTEEAYVMVIKAEAMKKVAYAYDDMLKELMRNVEIAYKHGMKPQNDVLKVQVKMNESKLNIRKAENALKLAKMNLCHYIGISLTTDIKLSENFPSIENKITLLENNIMARPEYEMIEKQVAIAQQQVKLNRSEMLPKVGIQGGYNYLHGVEINDELLFDKANFSVLLNVTIPIFHFGKHSNKMRAAKAQLQQRQIEKESLHEQMLLEWTQAANNMDEALLENQLAEQSLEQAEESRRVSHKQYEAGLETLSDYLESQAMWQKAYESVIEARYNLYLNELKYRKASGNL